MSPLGGVSRVVPHSLGTRGTPTPVGPGAASSPAPSTPHRSPQDPARRGPSPAMCLPSPTAPRCWTSPALGAQRGPDSSVRSGSAFSPRLELSLGKSCLGWDLKASVLKKKNKSLRVGGRQQPGAALAGMKPPLAEAPQTLCPRVPGAPGRWWVPPAWHQAQALGGVLQGEGAGPAPRTSALAALYFSMEFRGVRALWGCPGAVPFPRRRPSLRHGAGTPGAGQGVRGVGGSGLSCALPGGCGRGSRGRGGDICDLCPPLAWKPHTGVNQGADIPGAAEPAGAPLLLRLPAGCCRDSSPTQSLPPPPPPQLLRILQGPPASSTARAARGPILPGGL